jgi:hypothetical protein
MTKQNNLRNFAIAGLSALILASSGGCQSKEHSKVQDTSIPNPNTSLQLKYFYPDSFQMILGDYNNDGNQDYILGFAKRMGAKGHEYVTYLYLGDGKGNFTLKQ